MEELSVGDGFQNEIGRTLDADRSTVRDAAGQTEGAVGQEQDRTKSNVTSEGASTRRQAHRVQTQAEHQAASTTERVDAGGRNAEQAQEAVGQHGGELAGRVREFQRGQASLTEAAAEGLKDLNPFRDAEDTRAAKSRETLFQETAPHPNFYPESRLKALEPTAR